MAIKRQDYKTSHSNWRGEGLIPYGVVDSGVSDTGRMVEAVNSAVDGAARLAGEMSRVESASGRLELDKRLEQFLENRMNEWGTRTDYDDFEESWSAAVEDELKPLADDYRGVLGEGEVRQSVDLTDQKGRARVRAMVQLEKLRQSREKWASGLHEAEQEGNEEAVHKHLQEGLGVFIEPDRMEQVKKESDHHLLEAKLLKEAQADPVNMLSAVQSGKVADTEDSVLKSRVEEEARQWSDQLKLGYSELVLDLAVQGVPIDDESIALAKEQGLISREQTENYRRTFSENDDSGGLTEQAYDDWIRRIDERNVTEQEEAELAIELAFSGLPAPDLELLSERLRSSRLIPAETRSGISRQLRNLYEGGAWGVPEDDAAVREWKAARDVIGGMYEGEPGESVEKARLFLDQKVREQEQCRVDYGSLHPDEEEKNREDEKNLYWRRNLAGDLLEVPLSVRSAAGFTLLDGENGRDRFAGVLMRSWAVDHLGVTPEQAVSGWRGIRQSLARELGVDEDDQQLFIALSERQKTDLAARDKLQQLYADSYRKEFLRDGSDEDGDVTNDAGDMPEYLQEAARLVAERGGADARAEKERLKEAAEDVWAGVCGVLVNEAYLDRNFTETAASHSILVDNFMGMALRKKAVNALKSLSGEDRQKVYSILVPRLRKREGLGKRMLRGVTRGSADVLENGAQLGINAYSMGVKKLGRAMELLGDDFSRGLYEHADDAAETARLNEELKRFVHHEVLPVHVEDAGWIDNLLIDSSSIVPATALAFTGAGGVGLLAASETGRHMSDARQMNAEGDFEVQMRAAAGSGLISTLLSVGMSKLGARIAENSFRAFRQASGGTVGNAARSLGQGAAHASRDLVLMSAENKLQELGQYAAQELASSLSGRESGVPWEDWKERNTSFKAQLREASAMFPLLMIGAGKVSLRHFNDARPVLADGVNLEKLGVRREEINRIMAETDLDQRNRILVAALNKSPLWGSLYLGKKAFEWARILENPDMPLFKTEQEARDFLKMGPVKGEKTWAKVKDSNIFLLDKAAPDLEFQAQLIHERWKMRSGLPEVEKVLDSTGTEVFKVRFGEGIRSSRGSHDVDMTGALKEWHRSELNSEQNDLRAVVSGRLFSLPDALLDYGPFDPNRDVVRKSYLSDRLQDVIYRPYRMLMLKYPPEKISLLKWDAAKCEEQTSVEIEASRSILYEGVMRLAEGQDWNRVADDISLGVWGRWVGDGRDTRNRNMEWLGSVRECLGNRMEASVRFPKTKRVLENPDSIEAADMAEALREVSDYYAKSSETERSALPVDLREMCRMVWKSQGDVMNLFHLLPNLSDFDVLISRGYGPDQAYARMLKQQLEIELEQVRRYSVDLPPERLNPGGDQPRGYKYYHFMDDAVELLGKVSKNNFQKTIGIDGEPLWRVRYPNGRYSAWHHSEELARQDLAGHLATVFSPEGSAKMDIVPFLIKNQRDGGMFVDMQDINVHRLQEGTSGGAVFSRLAQRATSDLIRWNFGRRSRKSPGEKLQVLLEDGSLSAEALLNDRAVSDRRKIHEKYVGPIEQLGIDASNKAESNMKGLLLHKLELYNKNNPLALIEDKAEMVWDRLIRSGQLPEAEAWQALRVMGRVGKSSMYKGEYMRLIEELSQLSKEYYFANLDHLFVPESVAAWGRYAVSRPMPTPAEMSKLKESVKNSLAVKEHKRTAQDNRMVEEWIKVVSTEQMRMLADASSGLAAQLDNSGLPAGFLHMLSDSTGMNENSCAERFWGAMNNKCYEDCFPLAERYMHGIQKGNLLEVLPRHIADDLAGRLAPDIPGSAAGYEYAARELKNMADVLAEFPDVSKWGKDPERPNGYVSLVRKSDKGNLFGNLDIIHERIIDQLPIWMKKAESPRIETPSRVFDDYSLRKRTNLPSKWDGREDVRKAVETLSIVRAELSGRPLAYSEGVRWGGKVYHSDSPDYPPGVPGTWRVDAPLQSAILPILHTGHMQEAPRMSHTPSLRDPVEAIHAMKNCALYIDPEDRGHTVRLMPGMPEAPNREARHPYIVHSCHGIFLDEHGRPVPPSDMRRSYIPLELFKGADPDVNLTPQEAVRYKREVQKRLLDEFSNLAAQKKRWWSMEKGDSNFCESVIRLYEESGAAAAYERGDIGLNDPAFVQTLRFVSHVLNSPGEMVSSLESGMPYHSVILKEGQHLKLLYEEADAIHPRQNGHEE